MRVIAGRYRLVDFLGAGGMGRVWRAHDQQLGVDVAVKEVLRPAGIPDDLWSELLVRARREARHGARLRDHPNIVAVFDVVVEDAVPWTVMRLVKGTSLETRLKEGALSVDEAQRVAVAILGALGAAHGAGIIHRDVKPANIMLADEGGVLLTDFGIAVNDADTKITQDGGIIGSMAYIAPERADGQQGDEGSDLFSLGATLYEATEGVSPFQRDTLTGTLRAVAFHEPPPPTKAGHLAPLITALLSKEPGGRPTVAEAFIMATAGAATVTVPGKQKASPTPSEGVTEEESAYDVVLKEAGDRKIQVIKAVSELTGDGLKVAKHLVDGAPRTVLTKVDRKRAAEAKAALVEAGATVALKKHGPRRTSVTAVKKSGPKAANRPTPVAAPAAEPDKSAKPATNSGDTSGFWFTLIGLLVLLLWYGGTHHWLPNVWHTITDSGSPTPSPSARCDTLLDYCHSAHFNDSGTQFAGQCSKDSGCPVSGTFTNAGRQTGGASVTFNLSNDGGAAAGQCTTPIPVAAPDAVVTASCTIYPSITLTSTVHLQATVNNPTPDPFG
ncbi:serine/threonine protein kinase [Streptacidiphilus pinicola]|uniref:non-specific serine/threonine protein kinase n=2 Tax=Streptacidiphilus pinicola TaxID=2219663 RepID=A0A2X0I6W5_9ACTN|nr:serine/threonine protein kinase [Streptacidiphilus pinicola]